MRLESPWMALLYRSTAGLAMPVRSISNPRESRIHPYEAFVRKNPKCGYFPRTVSLPKVTSQRVYRMAKEATRRSRSAACTQAKKVVSFLHTRRSVYNSATRTRPAWHQIPLRRTP